MASLIWKGTGFSQLYCFVHQSPMRVVLRAELDSRKSSALREKKKEGVTKFIKCQARILTICLLPLELYFSDAVPPPLRVPGGANGKEPTYQCRANMRQGFDPWGQKIPWSRKWQPAPVFLPGEFHGNRRLAGYSLYGRKESDTPTSTQSCVSGLQDCRDGLEFSRKG